MCKYENPAEEKKAELQENIGDRLTVESFEETQKSPLQVKTLRKIEKFQLLNSYDRFSNTNFTVCAVVTRTFILSESRVEETQ